MSVRRSRVLLRNSYARLPLRRRAVMNLRAALRRREAELRRLVDLDAAGVMNVAAQPVAEPRSRGRRGRASPGALEHQLVQSALDLPAMGVGQRHLLAEAARGRRGAASSPRAAGSAAEVDRGHAGPSSTRRSAGSATNAQISSLAHGPSLVSSLSCGTGPGWRASISITHLPGRICYAQPPVGLGPRRQIAAHRHRHEAGEQRLGEQHLAVLLGGLVLDVGRDHQLDRIGVAAVHHGVEQVLLGASLRPLLQPQHPRVVALRDTTTASPRIFSASSPVSAGTCASPAGCPTGTRR